MDYGILPLQKLQNIIYKIHYIHKFVINGIWDKYLNILNQGSLVG
jgi:hypothetical protein